MENILRATAIYSGGNIYLYYAELDNGNWIMGDDDWLIVVNTNPLIDDETFEDSSYYEWQKEHLVEAISDKDYQKVLNNILEVIFAKKTIKEYDNFDEDELLYRYKEED